MCVCLYRFAPRTASKELNIRLCTENTTPLLESRLNHADSASHCYYHHGYYYSSDYRRFYDYHCYYLIICLAYILIFHSPHDCQAQILIVSVLWPTTLGSKKWFNTFSMCCEPIWTALGKTYWVLMEVAVVVVSYFLVSPAFCFDTKTPAPRWTQTLTREEQCTLEIARWKCEEVGDTTPLSAGTRCRLFHVVHVDSRVSETFHHRPFVSQPCRTLGPSWGSWRWCDFQCSARSSRLQHICVFSHQCEIVQYDGCLMLKQDWY